MNKIKHRSLPEKTADVISDMIYRNQYGLGAKLPNENELAALFEVSRNTVRSAVKILESRKLLEVRRGSGTFVSAKMGITEDPLGLLQITDKNKLFGDLLQVRLMIEPRMASMAAEYANATNIERLHIVYEKMEDAFGKGENYYEHDMEFHSAIAKLSENLVIHSLIPTIHQAIILQENMTEKRLGKVTLKAHRRIYEAIAAHRCNEAYDAMLSHLMQTQERLSWV